MTKKKSFWSFVLAICLIIPTMIMFTACGKNKKENQEQPVEHTHTFSADWSKDATHHWYAATCEHTSEKSGYVEHTFGAWTVTTEAGFGTTGSRERVCSVCEYKATETISALDAKTNTITVGEIDFTYSGKPQAIDSLITASNKTGMVVEYEGTNGTTYTKSTTAPTNAGSYKYTITIPATAEWAKGEKTEDFEIKKYKVTCPDKFESSLSEGKITTTKLCEINLEHDDNINLDEVELVYSNPDKPDGYGAGRTNIGRDRIKVHPNFADNIEVTGLPGNSKYIEWIVLDENDAFSFRYTKTTTAGSCYVGTIDHGYVKVGDKLTVLNYNESNSLFTKVNVTVTAIGYYDTNTSKYVDTTKATKGENIEITFTKDNASDNIASVRNIVSAQLVDEINTNTGYESRTVDLSLGSSEFRMLKIKINTNQKCKLTISDTEKCKLLKVYNATTGEEITLSDGTFQVAEGTEIYIIIQQGIYKGTQQVKVEIINYTFDA